MNTRLQNEYGKATGLASIRKSTYFCRKTYVFFGCSAFNVFRFEEDGAEGSKGRSDHSMEMIPRRMA